MILTENIKSFISSKYCTWFWFFASIIVLLTGTEIPGSIVIGLLVGIALLFADDIVPLIFPVLLIVSFVIRCKNSKEEFMQYLWAIPVILICLTVFFIRNRKGKEFKKGEYFYPFLATSIVVTLGGIGIITSSEYFSTTSLIYMLTLGFGALIFYFVLRPYINSGNKRYDVSVKISQMMCLIIVFLFISVLQYYLTHLSKFLSDPDILPFQWRNNASTLLMIAMPFAFYMASKKRAYILLPLLDYITIVFTGSRGGLIFGAVEILILIIYTCVKVKELRKPLLVLCGVCIAALAVTVTVWLPVMRYTFKRLTDYNENKIRLGLWYRAIEDFKSNPTFGRGLGYMGNRDIHESKDGTLCWYHNSVLQVIGSFGIAGIFGYGYSLFERIRIYLKHNNGFTSALFFSYIGLFMMGLVNPGIFAPVYLVIMIFFFILTEGQPETTTLIDTE